MNRRGFLSALIGAAVLDPERLLWVPGRKVYVIPALAQPTCDYFSLDEFRRLFIIPSVEKHIRALDRAVSHMYQTCHSLT